MPSSMVLALSSKAWKVTNRLLTAIACLVLLSAFGADAAGTNQYNPHAAATGCTTSGTQTTCGPYSK